MGAAKFPHGGVDRTQGIAMGGRRLPGFLRQIGQEIVHRSIRFMDRTQRSGGLFMVSSVDGGMMVLIMIAIMIVMGLMALLMRVMAIMLMPGRPGQRGGPRRLFMSVLSCQGGMPWRPGRGVIILSRQFRFGRDQSLKLAPLPRRGDGRPRLVPGSWRRVLGRLDDTALKLVLRCEVVVLSHGVDLGRQGFGFVVGHNLEQL